MAMGGTGVASASKFNASFHNPALIAFNRGDKPDKISISAFMGARELYNESLNDDIRNFQKSDVRQNYIDATGSLSTLEEFNEASENFSRELGNINLSSYRADETNAFSLLVDTKPVTINFFTRRDIREITTILNLDEQIIQDNFEFRNYGSGSSSLMDLDADLKSSVDNTVFKMTEFGVTVATTNVIEYNMPISWGYTPKLIQMNGSHQRAKILDYDVTNPPDQQPSVGLLEWNLDIGFAILLTDSFLENELGLDGFWLEGEWVFGIVGMNMVPTDFQSYGPARSVPELPATKRAIQPLYQVGLAHYRENFMVTLDIDLVETEVWDFEGLTRFVSMGGEYYWRDDFHLRAGLRINTAQTTEAAKDKAMFTTGFLYQPHGFSIEAAALVNDVELGGTVGFGLAF